MIIVYPYLSQFLHLLKDTPRCIPVVFGDPGSSTKNEIYWDKSFERADDD